MRNVKALRQKLYEYHMKAGYYIASLSRDEIAALDAFREANPMKSDLDWPEIQKRFGRRPGGPELVTPIRRSP